MKIPYRAEIDGLRALAVLAVVLYHAQFSVLGAPRLQGGFIGVDIFFVISGYLISKIILVELGKTHKFSFSNFYERRARRILPVLLTVMLVSLPFAWQALLPSDLVEYSKSIISSLLISSNFFFIPTVYIAESALQEPFLHTWSLSVEEQFYILFPVTFFIFHKWFRTHIATLTVVGILISLQLSEHASVYYTKLNFYLLPSRIWELLTGTLLAIFDIRYGRQHHKFLHQVLPMLGIYLITYAILFFNGTTPHPSFITIIPVVGTALVIIFANRDELVGATLSSKPFVGIGLISYSMYLWHYPVFSFARMKGNILTNSDKVAWIILVFTLSIATYYLIEKPFRNKVRFKARFAITSIAAALLITGATHQWLVSNEGFKHRVPEILRYEKLDYKPWLKLVDADNQACYDRYDELCSFGILGAKHHIALLGDSHLATLQSNLVKRLSNNSNLTIATNGGCWPLKNFYLYAKKIKNDTCTPSQQEQRIAEATRFPNSTIIIGGRLPLYITSHLFDNNEGGIEGRRGGRMAILQTYRK